jgi:hypothetical protein
LPRPFVHPVWCRHLGQRAELIGFFDTLHPANRLTRNIAAHRSIAPDSLRAVEGAEHTTIVTGDRTILTVFNVDAELEGISRHIMAGVVRMKIAQAMTAYRIDRSPRALLINTGYVLGATLVLVLLLLALRRLFRWLDTVAERRFASRLEGLEAQSFELRRPGKC